MTFRVVVLSILKILVKYRMRELDKQTSEAWEDYCEARKDVNDLRRLISNEEVNLDK